jgi:EAL domain-containing protein (putative c-di-GMP-specific phosphodiesterase class I)
MYHAKSCGRNNYQFYKASLNAAAVERFSLERDLKHAVDREELTLCYQPQVQLSTRRIVGAEALIRWHHPTKGTIPPDKFIQIAEESNLIIDINAWVLKTACRQGQQWRDKGLPPIRIAINLSGYKVADPPIIDSIEAVLRESDLDASCLELDITENVLLQATEETISTFQEMKDLRIRIALDDFGTGYSSLSYLTAFPVDTLKIDRSFVMECAEKRKNRLIIKAIAAMGQSMGMRIIAEGIETETQFDIIKGYGCDEAQGYYFSPPVSPERFSDLLEKGVL